MIIEKACAADYDELLDTLNECFGKNQDNSFELILPAMWQRNEEAMSRHLIVRDGKRIAAVVGVYPLPVTIAGKKLLFSTVGNVGTRAEYRLGGYMKALMTAAMDELNAMGADASRLGGARQRYNRYGYELAGQQFTFSISRKNAADYYGTSFPMHGPFTPQCSFRKITPEEQTALDYAQSLLSKQLLHVDRGDNRRFYDIMTAWQSEPWLAINSQGSPVGFLSVSPNGTDIAEHYAETPKLDYQMLLDWRAFKDANAVTFVNAPWQTECNRLASDIAGQMAVSLPSNFKIINFLGVAEACMAAKASYSTLPEGTFSLAIQDYGVLTFHNDSVAKTRNAPDLTLDRLQATRLLFGHLPASSVAELPSKVQPYADALFPLPLWWNGQDRV